ncbi:NnrS family protein [Candidatus Nitrotoga sp. M5]|uniref:NnrS family protein n=1 Tax=Candidatus Nitrotoga sp. M5 TaxID=2890409 RepID=UPI001EF3BA21|nr:NnrS family protein [Candidatus Nitrotoga sp. M5]CAH1385618.1 NnrS protein involved in response to NO [Candidatus Nitrotoga sp. M5]
MILSKQWHIFSAAPHRVMFFGGALQAVAVMVWLLTELLTSYGVLWHPLAWAIAPNAAHAWLMMYGLFPFFMFGFLMTTYPRWMKGSDIPRHRYMPAFLLLILGTVSFYLGLFFSHTLLIIAIVSTLSGWLLALYALLRVLLDTTHQNKRHPQLIFVALSLGWCSLVAYLVWLLSGNAAWLHLSIQGGLWLFLLPVFSSVAHRMIPFFTASALTHNYIPSPHWAWWIILAASAGHGLLQINNASAWLWLCDAPLAIVALYLTHSWGLRRSLKFPLLGILHIGFAWIGIAMLLFAVQSFVLFISNGETFIWRLAPLHALTIGCFSTLLIGMATRVTLGHSGLPMNVGKPINLMFIGIQLVAILRVLADILPIQTGHWLYVAAGAVWLACFGSWAVRYFPVYWRPRTDGRPG